MGKEIKGLLKFILETESKTINEEIGGIANWTKIINLDIVELYGQYSSIDLREIADKIDVLKNKLENLRG